MSAQLLVRRIVGESMIPSFWPGQLIVAARWYRSLRAGDVVVILHDNKEKIKRIQRIENGKLYVVGDNPPGSTDSRQFGWLPTTAVQAKVIWPSRAAPTWHALNQA